MSLSAESEREGEWWGGGRKVEGVRWKVKGGREIGKREMGGMEGRKGKMKGGVQSMSINGHVCSVT